MPDSWPSMRSIARYVFPVLVGPRTAVRRPDALAGDIDPNWPLGGADARLAGDRRLELVGAQHRPVVGLLHDHCQSLLGLETIGGHRPVRFRTVPWADDLEVAHDVEVVEAMALVFAALDRRRM